MQCGRKSIGRKGARLPCAGGTHYPAQALPVAEPRHLRGLRRRGMVRKGLKPCPAAKRRDMPWRAASVSVLLGMLAVGVAGAAAEPLTVRIGVFADLTACPSSGGCGAAALAALALRHGNAGAVEVSHATTKHRKSRAHSACSGSAAEHSSQTNRRAGKRAPGALPAGEPRITSAAVCCLVGTRNCRAPRVDPHHRPRPPRVHHR